MGARVTLIEADCDRVLPFPDGRFSAALSRLALMIATDPVATLRELWRVTAAGGRIVTALWAPVSDDPWFALPRAAAAAVVGGDRADCARAFDRNQQSPAGGSTGGWLLRWTNTSSAATKRTTRCRAVAMRQMQQRPR
jgi:SAM-dependent methyltransferase